MIGSIFINPDREERSNMQKEEKKLFKIAAILCLILIIIIYSGSFLKYLLKYSWYGTATVIVVIFIWITIFLIATIVVTRGLYLIRKRDEKKRKLDFIAWLGVLTADYRQSGNEIDLLDFYKEICKEDGIKDAPDLEKYYNKQKKLIEGRESVMIKLRREIEEAANRESKEK